MSHLLNASPWLLQFALNVDPDADNQHRGSVFTEEDDGCEGPRTLLNASPWMLGFARKLAEQEVADSKEQARRAKIRKKWHQRTYPKSGVRNCCKKC